MEWVTLIFGLVNAFLAQCQQKNNPSQTPAEAQAELRSRYNAVTGKMDPSLVRQVVPQVKRAELKARREGTKEDRRNNPRLTKQQLSELAEKKLIEAMSANKQAVKAAYASALKLGADE